MPTYQYACTSCGEQVEVVQKFTDDPLTVCPMCGGALRKVYSAVGIVFKGSGFYRTDSRAEAKSGSGTTKGSSDSSPDGSSSDGESKTGSDSGKTGSDSGKPASSSSSKGSQSAAASASSSS